MKRLLQAEMDLSPGDGETTVILPFSVPERVRTISARLTYSPTALDDPGQTKALIQAALKASAPWEAPGEWEKYAPLSNLITLSLDDPAGYRGNAHRKDPNQSHALSEAGASPGFLPGTILPGPWRASIHIHALVTPSCALHLLIEGEEA